uniref:Taste receptor type 2 n=1 Tax=Myripristis murdjan TaxID=586833 RepID=A0A668AYG1_9TELE
MAWGEMSDEAFLWINGPLVMLSLPANVFFACSLMFPPRGRQKLKQPVKILLGFVVWCTIIFLISLIVRYSLVVENAYFNVTTRLLLRYSVFMSMTSCVWMSFYYHTQIVPARRALSIWVRKNIKSIIYIILFLDRSVFFFNIMVSIVKFIKENQHRNDSINNTDIASEEFYGKSNVCFIVIKVHTTLCLCLMMFSSFSTVHYLRTHMRRLAKSGGGDLAVSSRRLRGHMRVTVTGILQGLLYLLCEVWNQLKSFVFNYSLHFTIDELLIFTVSTAYMCGTTVNMAVSQAVFRQKAADVWTALRAVLCVDGTTGNDVKLHSSQSTTLDKT